jgi:hypothetical protein
MSYEWLVEDLDGLDFEFSGGVDEARIEAASKAIGLPLPPSYVAFLRQFGSGYISFHELMGLGGPRHLDVVEQTRWLRVESKISPFPPFLIPVLADGYGNYDCLNAGSAVKGAEQPVVQWLHDGGENQHLSVIAATYEGWLRLVVDQIRRVESDD